MRSFALVSALVIGAGVISHGAYADQKSDDVQTLMDLTGRNTAVIEREVDNRVRFTLQVFIDQHPDLTGDEVVKLQTQVFSAEKTYLDTEGAEIAGYFGSRLSDEQIKAAIAFFSSPEGKAYRAANHAVTHELTREAQQRLPILIQSIKDILWASLKGHNPLPQPTAPKAG